DQRKGTEQPAIAVSDAAGAVDDPLRKTARPAGADVVVRPAFAAVIGVRLQPGGHFAATSLDWRMDALSGGALDGDAGPGLFLLLPFNGGSVYRLLRHRLHHVFRTIHELDDPVSHGLPAGYQRRCLRQ